MPTLSQSHRAQAEITQTGYVSALNQLLSRAADFLFPCRHRHTSLPYNSRQRCLDCGASRLYIFDADFEHADAGIFRGPWKRPARRAQAARRVVAQTLISTATAPARRPINGCAAILNPGSESPLFQRRPLVSQSAGKAGAQ